jgi:hypothetical protein
MKLLPIHCDSSGGRRNRTETTRVKTIRRVRGRLANVRGLWISVAARGRFRSAENRVTTATIKPRQKGVRAALEHDNNNMFSMIVTARARRTTARNQEGTLLHLVQGRSDVHGRRAYDIDERDRATNKRFDRSDRHGQLFGRDDDRNGDVKSTRPIRYVTVRSNAIAATRRSSTRCSNLKKKKKKKIPRAYVVTGTLRKSVRPCLVRERFR